MAELGDVRRFPHRSSIVAFAGVDPGVVGSGKMQLSSVATSKRGSPQLRRLSFKWFLLTLSANPKTKQFTSSMLKSVMRKTLLRLYYRCRKQIPAYLLCPRQGVSERR